MSGHGWVVVRLVDGVARSERSESCRRQKEAGQGPAARRVMAEMKVRPLDTIDGNPSAEIPTRFRDAEASARDLMPGREP